MATQERGELRCLVDAGLTPMQALRAGTKWAAQCLALEREVGTLEKGRLADLVVVHGNPHNDITVLLEPAHIEVVLRRCRDVEDLEQALPVTDASSGAL